MDAQTPVALVTGASSGIGAATAECLASAGYRVYGTSRHTAQSDSRRFEMLTLDITDDASTFAAIERLVGAEGHLDILVNNAGVGVAPAADEEQTLDLTRSIFETNVFGTIRVTHAVLPHMRRQRRGRIINMSSIVGFLPAPYMAVYAATKHAIEGYSESIDHELRQFGIRVSVIEPGFIKSQIEAHSLRSSLRIDDYEDERKAVTRRTQELLAAADEPNLVADVVLEAVRTQRPRHRYAVGSSVRRLQLLRRFAPSLIVDGALRKEFRLES